MIYWKGCVFSVFVVDFVIDFECELVYIFICCLGLCVKFEYGCCYVLYGWGCNVNWESYWYNGMVIGMS